MDEYKRIRDLTDRALRDPEGQEGRSCAVLALQQLSKSSLLPWQETPKVSDQTRRLSVRIGDDTFTLLPASRFWAVCKGCAKSIPRGMECYWAPGRGAFHVGCLS